MTDDYQKLIEDCDEAIRAGHASVVMQRLRALNSAKVPSRWRLPIAQICRRAGLWGQGLSILKHVVAENESGAATPSERAEYAMLLFRLGATAEAISILSSVDRAEAPESHHYAALIHMARWEFGSAINELERFLEFEPEPYQELVGCTNLAFAYIEAERYDLARRLLHKNLQACAAGGYGRLLCSNLANRAHLHIACKDYHAAEVDIAAGEPIVESSESSDRLLFLKWKLILEGLQSHSLKPIDDFRTLAAATNSWEYLRLADLYALRIRFDMGRFLHLIFGTPFAGFRDRVCREMGALPDRNIFVLGDKSAPRFDLATGEVNGHSTDIAGDQPHQMIEILLRDFYHPMRIAGLFSELYPGNHFDPKSSRNRTHAVVIRTRQWLRANEIPMQVHERGGFYSLRFTGPFSIRIPLRREAIDPMRLQLEKLRRSFGETANFQASTAREQLNISRQTLQRIVDWGLNHGHLERLGTGRKTSYRFKALKSAA